MRGELEVVTDNCCHQVALHLWLPGVVQDPGNKLHVKKDDLDPVPVGGLHVRGDLVRVDGEGEEAMHKHFGLAAELDSPAKYTCLQVDATVTDLLLRDYL